MYFYFDLCKFWLSNLALNPTTIGLSYSLEFLLFLGERREEWYLLLAKKVNLFWSIFSGLFDGSALLDVSGLLDVRY
jgi:hypothetical protein